jgi:hypothetical protein
LPFFFAAVVHDHGGSTRKWYHKDGGSSGLGALETPAAVVMEKVAMGFGGHSRGDCSMAVVVAAAGVKTAGADNNQQKAAAGAAKTANVAARGAELALAAAVAAAAAVKVKVWQWWWQRQE